MAEGHAGKDADEIWDAWDKGDGERHDLFTAAVCCQRRI